MELNKINRKVSILTTGGQQKIKSVTAVVIPASEKNNIDLTIYMRTTYLSFCSTGYVSSSLWVQKRNWCLSGAPPLWTVNCQKYEKKISGVETRQQHDARHKLENKYYFNIEYKTKMAQNKSCTGKIYCI